MRLPMHQAGRVGLFLVAKFESCPISSGYCRVPREKQNLNQGRNCSCCNLRPNQSTSNPPISYFGCMDFLEYPGAKTQRDPFAESPLSVLSSHEFFSKARVPCAILVIVVSVDNRMIIPTSQPRITILLHSSRKLSYAHDIRFDASHEFP